MKIYTSYFAKAYQFPDDKYTCIAISSSLPRYFKNLKPGSFIQYKKLCPSWDIIMEYKRNGADVERYKSRYYNEILNKLDVDQVYKELEKLSNGKDIVLFGCNGLRGKNKFCHRHLVIKWFKDNGYEEEALGELFLNYYKNNKRILKPVKEIIKLEF